MDILMLIQAASQGGIDWTGISVLLGVVITGTVTILNTIWNRRDARTAATQRAAQSVVLAQTHDLADGAHKELERQNIALKIAVAGGAAVPEQTVGAAGNAPVGQDKGVVTVEADQTSHNRRSGDV
jgi:hypothetical protein